MDRVVAIRDGQTSSETVRQAGPPQRRGDGTGGAAAETGEPRFEELVVVDSAGRLQVPKEYLQRLNIKGRVRLELREDEIAIRPVQERHGGARGREAGRRAGRQRHGTRGVDWLAALADVDRTPEPVTSRQDVAARRVNAPCTDRALIEADDVWRVYKVGRAGGAGAARDQSADPGRAASSRSRGARAAARRRCSTASAAWIDPHRARCASSAPSIARLNDRQLTALAARAGGLHLPVVRPAAHALGLRERGADAAHRGHAATEQRQARTLTAWSWWA